MFWLRWRAIVSPGEPKIGLAVRTRFSDCLTWSQPTGAPPLRKTVPLGMEIIRHFISRISASVGGRDRPKQKPTNQPDIYARNRDYVRFRVGLAITVFVHKPCDVFAEMDW